MSVEATTKKIWKVAGNSLIQSGSHSGNTVATRIERPD